MNLRSPQFVKKLAAPSATKPRPPFIDVRNFDLFYGEKKVLTQVSLPVASRRITAIVGPSGCGKTSLLSAINRLTDLIPACRVSGEIRLGNQEIHARDIDVIQLRRRIGMIFQKPTPFPFSIERNIQFPLREHGIKDRRRLAEIAEAALRDVGLWNEVKDRLKDPARTLSGGQQQRLCIARAIALKPEALLLDEPCAALDPISGGVIEDLMIRLKKRYTLLIVTHNLSQAKRISDRCAFFCNLNGLGGARLIEYGSSAQIFDAPRDPLTAAYVNGGRGSCG
ncbi:MAG: phosphate ABC transporter ATP-binding protein [Nitrospiria bacterium]